MCHAEFGPSPKPDVETAEVAIPVEGDEAIPTFSATGNTAGPRGAVVVVGDIFGARTPFYEHVAAMLGSCGYDAVVPEFFFREGPLAERTPEAAFERRGRLDERRTLRDLEAVVTWLKARPSSAGTRVGTLGFCLGGSFVLNLAAMRDDLATVCYYGFPAGPPGPPRDPARTAPKPLDEVERVNGPILGFWGELDERVGIPNVEAYARALNERGVPFDHTIYPGLDHGFLAANFEPDADGHDAARESWAKMCDFYAEHLG